MAAAVALAKRVECAHSPSGAVSASKTIATALSALYAATSNAAKRRQWFPNGALEVSSQTKSQYFRGAWNGARLEIGFYATEGGNAQIAIQVNKLATRAHVDR
jgi:hypothetical protein